jgi:hypothetical protein
MTLGLITSVLEVKAARNKIRLIQELDVSTRIRERLERHEMAGPNHKTKRTLGLGVSIVTNFVSGIVDGLLYSIWE